MAAAVAFYRLLGLDLPAEPEGHVEATLPGGVRVMFDTEEAIKSFDAEWQPPASAGRISFAFEVGQTGEVDATVEKLRRTGYQVKLEPFDAFWGQRYATVLDPDGNSVDIFAPLETEAAS
jgi:uncharacterized glyoxalase superfamily protein PhnB